MAYTATGFTKRIAYFSSPDLSYTTSDGDDIVTGTANRYLDEYSNHFLTDPSQFYEFI